MHYRVFSALLAGLFAGLLLIGSPLVEGQTVPGGEAGDVPPPPPGEDVQARGPVHEAYAEPTNSVGAPSVTVNKEPPAPIEEQPPEEKPAGDNVVWIPGYWNWDDESKDHLWVSGFWRTVPPNRTWTPGHWQRVGDGYQRVPGYWAAGEVTETEYLPPPPPTIDRGPSTPAPQPTSTYVPGLWIYQTNRFLWRPGYWVGYRPNWVWTPSCYRWTPGGYIYVAGFWDVPLLDRGLLFAPVRFAPRLLRPGFVFRPTFVVQPDFLCGALFVRTKAPCFYFGNYFEPRYRRSFVSWVDYRVNKTVVDVNFNYYRAAYAGHPTWERNLRTLYTERFSGVVARPPITLVQQSRVIRNITVNKTVNTMVHKNIAITHMQNASVLAPINRVHGVQVTAMASLASTRPGFIKTAPVRRDVRVEHLSKERVVAERRSVERFNTIARERRTGEAGIIKRSNVKESVKVRINVPKGTPAARTFVHPKPPPPPNRPRPEMRK